MTYQFIKRIETIKRILIVNEIEYYFSHYNVENSEVYVVCLKMNDKKYSIELVKNTSGLWFFHVELKGKMIFDSRIGNAYYKNPEDAQSKMIKAFLKKYNSQSNDSYL